MKKLLSLLLVMLMLITTLISCSFVEQFLPKKDETPVDTVDREVTEEEWNANMKATNFEMTAKGEHKSASRNETYDQSYKFAENKAMIQTEWFNGYAVCKDNVWYLVQKSPDGNGYVGEEKDYGEFEFNVGFVLTLMELSSNYSEIFSSFAYDGDKGAYVYTPDHNPTCVYSLYFENGILVKYEISDITEEYTHTVVCTFTNYGTTIVDVPEFTISSEDTVDREVTEEEWNANMNATNYEAYITHIGVDEFFVLPCKSSENAMYFSSYVLDNVYLVRAKENDCLWYMIEMSEDGSGYVVTDTLEAPNVVSFGWFLETTLPLEWDYSNFTYNAQKGAYTWNLSPNDESTVELLFYFEDGKLVQFEVRGYGVQNGEEYNQALICTFKNIGTTVVDVPEFTIPSEDTVDREVSEEEWNANMLVTNYEQHVYFKYTMNGEVINSPETPWGIWKYTENAMYSTVNGEFNSAYVLKDGRWYKLIRNSHGEDSIEYKAYLDEDYNQALMEVEYKYSDFVYDADLGAYVIFVGDAGEAYGLGTLYDAKLYVYFENNIIVKYESSYYALSEDGTRIDVLQTSIIKNIGTTVVDIPEFTIPE